MKTKLQYSETHRCDGAGIFNGVYVSSVECDDTTARICTESNSEWGSGRATVKLTPDKLRLLAADLLTAAAFIEDNQAQRAVSDLTNTDAQ